MNPEITPDVLLDQLHEQIRQEARNKIIAIIALSKTEEE